MSYRQVFTALCLGTVLLEKLSRTNPAHQDRDSTEIHAYTHTLKLPKWKVKSEYGARLCVSTAVH